MRSRQLSAYAPIAFTWLRAVASSTRPPLARTAETVTAVNVLLWHDTHPDFFIDVTSFF
jgi:hypothetical protein